MKWRSGAYSLFTLCLSAPSGGEANAQEICHLAPSKLRFEDDAACFREPGARRRFPGMLKFIPLGQDDANFISLGGEARQRYEYTHNPLFGDNPQDKSGVWLQRFTLHADLRAGHHIRFFGQLSSALENGRAGGPGPVDENQLAAQNAFMDLSFSPVEDWNLTLRAGRQELQFGSGRLVDVREGPNVRRTFDAVHGILTMPGWKIDSVIGRPRLVRPGAFDDDMNRDQALWGGYAESSDLLPLGKLDIYYLGYENDAGSFVQGTEKERRHSTGLRWWGEKEDLDWNWEVLYQFGSFGDGDIRAWTLASVTGYTFAALPWQPRLALSVNIASGDSDPADPDLGTFNAIFPRGNYFSEAAVLGPRNFFNAHAFITVRPTDPWALTADMNFFWRLEKEDGVYGPSGQLIRAPGVSDERFVGSALSLTSEYTILDNLVFTTIYTHFFAGAFIKDTGPAQDIDFVEFTLQFKF